jgi:hypothetical protein
MLAPASRRRLLAVPLAVATTILGASALSLRVDPGAEALIPSSGEDVRNLREFRRQFGSDEAIVLALRSDRLFSSEALEVVEDLTRRASMLPHVARVLSPTNAPDLDGDELGPFRTVPFEDVKAGKLTAEELGDRLAGHPLYGGFLVSRDARTAAVVIEVEKDGQGGDARADLVRAVRRLAARPPAGFRAFVAGLPVEKVDVAASVRRDQMVFVPLIFGMLAAVTALLYRHATGVVVPLAVVIVSLLWTLGLIGLAGSSLNPVTSLVTPVVLVVSVAGAIHLFNHHLAGLSKGQEPTAALEEALRLCRVPCLNAALTTAVGFGSLALVPVPAIREFGVFSAAGVMIAYALTMTLAPLLIAALPGFPERVTSSFRAGTIERRLSAVTEGFGRRPLVTAGIAIALLAASVVGVARVRIETDLIRSMRESSPLTHATRFIDENLTGVNSLEIVVRGSPADDPGAMRKLEAFERSIAGLPGVRKVAGPPDLLARVNRAFHAGDDAYDSLPSGPGAEEDLRDFLDLLRREAPADLERYVSADGRSVRLAARVKALGSATSQTLLRRIREEAARAGLDDVVLTGDFVVLSNMSTSLVANQLRGLLPAFVLILAALAVQFRSWGLGLLSAVPNGVPILMVYGLMGWAGIPLSVPTSVIACVAVGMTVDNTIHLLARFRDGFQRSGDYVGALSRAVELSGRAIVFSTLVVAAGFFLGVFSSFLPSVHFAALTGAALLFGLLCQGTLLPLCLVVFRPLGRPAEAAPPRRRAIPLLLAAGLIPLAVPGAEWAGPASEVLLEDQFGRTDGVGLHRGRVVVLLYGKPADLRRMKSWELKIREKAAEAPLFLRAVDARAVRGRKTESEVNARLRESVPPEIAVLVDWGGDLAKAYGLPDGEVSVTVLDPAGKARGNAEGPVDREAVARVLEWIARAGKKENRP